MNPFSFRDSDPECFEAMYIVGVRGPHVSTTRIDDALVHGFCYEAPEALPGGTFNPGWKYDDPNYILYHRADNAPFMACVMWLRKVIEGDVIGTTRMLGTIFDTYIPRINRAPMERIWWSFSVSDRPLPIWDGIDGFIVDDARIFAGPVASLDDCLDLNLYQMEDAAGEHTFYIGVSSSDEWRALMQSYDAPKTSDVLRHCECILHIVCAQESPRSSIYLLCRSARRERVEACLNAYYDAMLMMKNKLRDFKDPVERAHFVRSMLEPR